jgi:hypothetical protein
VVWSSTPPLLDAEGANCLAEWQELFGAECPASQDFGWLAPGRRVEFEGPLAGLEPMTILTDLLPDRVYAATPREGTPVLARVQGRVAGTLRSTASGGSLAFLGFRPRDDQSQSLGYDARWWFDILDRLGAYPGTGRFAGANDNPEVVSRTGPWLCCRFPNGTVTIARHLHTYAECWPGGFGRKDDEDRRILEANPPPPREIRLDGLRVAGHTVSYDGHGPVSFRVDAAGNLIGFAGHQCQEIAVDGRTWRFADRRLNTLSWAPIPDECRVPGGAVLLLRVHLDGACELRIPAAGLPEAVEAVREGSKPGSRGEAVACRRDGEALVLSFAAGQGQGVVYIVPRPGG